MKRCSSCKEVKPLDDFHNSRAARDGKKAWCKECGRRYNAEYVKRNRVEVNRKALERYRKNPKRQREYRLFQVNNLTIEQYKQLEQLQNNCCAICGSSSSGRANYRWSVDHNHETGEPRGLLCYLCNWALGLFRDNSTTLSAAIEYLANPPARSLK